MASFQSKILLAVLAGLLALSAAESAGHFVPIFNGVSLKEPPGSGAWRTRDRSPYDHRRPNSSEFLPRGHEGVVDGFEFRCKFMIDGGNSGVQYRSFEIRESGPRTSWVDCN